MNEWKKHKEMRGGGNSLDRLRVPSQDWETPTAEVRGLYVSCFQFCLTLSGGSCTLRIMSTTVKSVKVTCNPVNEKNTFTNGDCVSGQVQLEIAKDCQIDSLFIKFKGKAEVLWTERHGQTTVVYHSKDKYFSMRHYFIKDKNLKGKWLHVVKEFNVD